MVTPELHVLPDTEQMAHAAASYVVEVARRSVAERGQCVIGLSGLGTPLEFYRTMASPPHVAELPWARTHLFMGDERWVPFSDSQSNAGMIMRELTGNVPVPQGNLHFIRTELITPVASAEEHERELRLVLPWPGMPRLDVMLHALAPDGHTASLEMGSSAFEGRDTITNAVVDTWLPRVQGPRVTFSYRLINNARHVVFITNNARRAEALRKVFRPRSDDTPIPAAIVRPTDGRLVWFVDRDAASLVSG